MLRLTCPGVSRLAPLSDQLPPIFLGGQTAAHSCELLLGERYQHAAALARFSIKRGSDAGSCSRREASTTGRLFAGPLM